ncbi:hypothetical protein HMPREF1870_00443 [Bacteroidales bacterium KA00344]|nr:hypothetical protein HMPREF1870_00443 [Bacteroidales bacterium KA00344]
MSLRTIAWIADDRIFLFFFTNTPVKLAYFKITLRSSEIRKKFDDS